MKDVFESVRFQQESPSAIKSGGCPLSSRIRVRFAQELLSVLARNCCPFCSGMSVRFAQEYAESYVLAETYSRKYIDGKQQLVEETGKFDIKEDDMSIHISDVSSIADFSDHHSTLSSSILHVETINDTEFVYSFENGGDNHEFRFIKKE